MTTHTVEYAKSSRAKCKGKNCGEKIEKDTIRIGKHSHTGDFDVTTWYHPACFTKPRGVEDLGEWIDNELEDTTDEGNILPDKKEELMQAIEQKVIKKKSEGGGDGFIAKLKREYDTTAAAGGDDVDEDQPKKKKSKSSSDDQKHQRALELYGKYQKMKGDDLKHILKWNRQVQSGTKPIMLHKVIDGEMNGRLARCTVCDGGRLKMNDDCTKVLCNGKFDEETQIRVPCSVEYKIEEAPRWQPWYTEEPTEEEIEEMKRLEEAANDGEADNGGEVVAGSELEKLLKDAEGLDVDMSDSKAIKATTAKLVEIFEANGTLDLSEEHKMKMKQVGPIVVGNKGLDAPALVKTIAKHFGFKEAKAAKAEAKKAAIDCANPANAPLVAAFNEMADLYFKLGNTNAGLAYKKAVGSLKELPIEVTVENAKSLGKSGRNKVKNIGLGSANKLHEFLATGTIEKLEQLRHDAAA